MKKFLIKFSIISSVTGFCVMGIAILFYEVLPPHYSLNYTHWDTKITRDHFDQDAPQYNTLILGVSDIQRNILPLALDELSPGQSRNSYNASEGALTGEYLTAFAEALVAKNSNIKTILLGVPHSEEFLLFEKEFLNKGLFWHGFGLEELFAHYGKGQEGGMIFLLLKKYFGSNLANIVKYGSLNQRISYSEAIYNDKIIRSGHPGIVQRDIDTGIRELGLGDDLTVCTQKCKDYFEERKKFSLSMPTEKDIKANKDTAEKDAMTLIEFARQSEARGIDVIFLYFPRYGRDAFMEKQIVMELEKHDCPLINFSNPEEYPELYSLKYSFGRYLNLEGARKVTEKIIPLINKYTHGHQCN